jgi:glutamine amidotransferase
MCRLFGLRANKPVDVEFSLATGPLTMRKLGAKHPNGWGIGWYERNSPAVKKEPIAAATSPDLPHIATEVRSHLVITHVRKATCGDVTEANCHPFKYRNWLFAHNGSVDRDALLGKLDSTHRSAIQGQTDSEVFFHWILQNVELTRSVPEGLRTALKEMAGFTGLNLILTDGANLYAYRNAAKSPGYYSLFYLRRDPKPDSFEEFHSAEVQALLRSKALRGEKAVLVCSERLTNEAWQEIPLGSLLVVAENLSANLVEVK